MKTANYKSLPDFFEFGPYRLDTRDKLLFQNEAEIHLTPKVVDILLALLINHGHIVEKEELMVIVWPDTVVEENNLTRNISTLRKILDDEFEDSYIETIPRRGYRFVADVREITESPENSKPTNPVLPLEERVNAPHLQQFAIAHTAEVEGEKSVGQKQSQSIGRGLARLFNGIKPVSLLSAALLITITVFFFLQMRLLYWLNRPIQPEKRTAFPQLRPHKLPAVGLPVEAALSPDGKYVIYASAGDTGKQSLYLNQVKTDHVLQLLPPTDSNIHGLSFDPDGSHIYYSLRGTNKSTEFYRLASLGGEPPQKLASLGLSGHAALSPDTRQLAFVRENADVGTSRLIVANADGSAESVLLERKLPEFFSLTSSPSWSADGRNIACVIGSEANDVRYQVAAIIVNRDPKPAISAAKWPWIKQVAWLPDGHLLILADEQTGGWHNQLWLMAWPSGTLNRITNDLNDYSGISSTADSTSLVTIQNNNLSDLWIVPYQTGGRSQRVTSFNQRREGLHGMDWMPNGHLIFSTMENGSEHIRSMDTNRNQYRDLTNSGYDAGNNYSPSVSPDGRNIVFVSDRQGAKRIWRMDHDGGNPQPLTDGPYDIDPQVSPDGNWIVYSSLKSGKQTLWKVPLKGGAATQILNQAIESLTLSPTGDLIACVRLEASSNEGHRLAVIDLEGNQPTRFFAMPFASHPVLIRWLPDGRALSYNLIRDGIANLWSLPLTTGQSKQITDLSFENIGSFAWSRDGKRLAVVRLQEIRSIVLFSGLK